MAASPCPNDRSGPPEDRGSSVEERVGADRRAAVTDLEAGNRELVAALDEFQVPYALIGGLAVALWGNRGRRWTSMSRSGWIGRGWRRQWRRCAGA